MNVYDFDETIFTGDTEDRFFEFMFKKKGFRHYKINWHFYNILWKLHIITKTRSREGQYTFLKDIKDLDATVQEYWDEIEKYMKPWYNDVKRPDDVIVSASPDFLIDEIGRRLGVRVIATKMDIHTGKILGENCADEEKVRRFKEEFPDCKIAEFYSDALRDAPMAEFAEKAYMVVDEGTRPIPWPDK